MRLTCHVCFLLLSRTMLYATATHALAHLRLLMPYAPTRLLTYALLNPSIVNHLHLPPPYYGPCRHPLAHARSCAEVGWFIRLILSSRLNLHPWGIFSCERNPTSQVSKPNTFKNGVNPSQPTWFIPYISIPINKKTFAIYLMIDFLVLNLSDFYTFDYALGFILQRSKKI